MAERASGARARNARAGKLAYEFTECAPGEYQYRVEFCGEKTGAKLTEYKTFLEGFGCRVFCKNINLNKSAVKLRFRPWGSGAGKFAASPGTYNKELLIVEKKNDGKPFELHTDNKDAAAYFGNLRNSYLGVAAVGMVLAALFIASVFTPFNFSRGFLSEWFGAALFAVIGAAGFVFAVKYAGIAKRYKKLGKMYD